MFTPKTPIKQFKSANQNEWNKKNLESVEIIEEKKIIAQLGVEYEMWNYFIV